MSVLVLMYHGVEHRPGPLFVEPELFSEHVAVIADSKLPVLTVAEIADRLEGGGLPPLAVALTFDDGFASVVDEGAPRLAARALRATVFCVAGRVGRTNEWATNRTSAPRVGLAPAGELSRLAAEGFEIGGHGFEHAPLDTDDADEIRREVSDGKAALEQAVGVPVRSFAYPYGAAPSRAALTAVATSYRAACTTRIARVHVGSDLLSLPRVDAHYLRSPERLASAISGESNAYLVARRLAASARRRVVPDYRR